MTRFYAIQHVLRPILTSSTRLSGNLAGATAVLLLMVGFGFKVAAVPFHQWAPTRTKAFCTGHRLDCDRLEGGQLHRADESPVGGT